MIMRSTPRINPEIDTEHGASSIFLYPTNEAALVCPRRGKVVCGVVGCRHVGWHSFDGSNFFFGAVIPHPCRCVPPFLHSILGLEWVQETASEKPRRRGTCTEYM
jgi:hypothetical protein